MAKKSDVKLTAPARMKSSALVDKPVVYGGDNLNVKVMLDHVFEAPANDLPIGRFAEVVDVIIDYIDCSIVGRNNRSKSSRSYESFEEFASNQMTKKPRRKGKNP
jgi:hypothetical protein